MANRLSKITTRTGDDGSTGLGDGTRVQKSAARIQVMGDLDELNSTIGVLLAEELAPPARERLTRIQNQLFDFGGEICIPGHRAITEQHVRYLDEAAGALNSTLSPLREFILPGGTRAAALCHVARTIARRAERSLVMLRNQEIVSAESLQYLNRLSDLLFVLARTLNRDAGNDDVLWQREPAPTQSQAD
jgi:cob(I)alamin adenosyltransferase